MEINYSLFTEESLARSIEAHQAEMARLDRETAYHHDRMHSAMAARETVAAELWAMSTVLEGRKPPAPEPVPPAPVEPIDLLGALEDAVNAARAARRNKTEEK